MWWEDKILRTFRVRLVQSPGVLGGLLADIGDKRGNIGEIRTIHMGSESMVRDITVFADDPAHLEALVAVVNRYPDAELLEVRDEVLEMHQGGKIAIRSRYRIDTIGTLRRVYTPGVAEVCLKIKEDPALARRFTAIRHFVAIVTDGTAVLGLGDIGPRAAMPVMEGKACLMETLTGLSGIPILLDTKDPDAIVRTVVNIAPTFSAIQLEDISAPRCFEIESRIQDAVDIPVMHDDQHGTACVVTAALMNASRIARVELKKCRIGVVGLGAAGFALTRMLMYFLGNPVWGADIAPSALDRLGKAGGLPSTLEEIMSSADVVVATTGRPGAHQAGDGPEGADHPGPVQPESRDRPGNGPEGGRGVRRRRKLGEQRPRLPRHLPGRRGRRRPPDHP